MTTQKQVTGDIMFELEELKRVDTNENESGPYSLTYAYGPVLTILCC